jgi:DNA-binding FadR family transcriptional regulator
MSEPDAAYYDATLGEFLLPYTAVRRALDPEATLLAFLQSTYEAAATLEEWDRAALEVASGSQYHAQP